MNSGATPVPSSGIADVAPPAVAHADAHPPAARRAVVSWIIYDLANVIFSMGVVSFTFPLWIRDQVGPDRTDAVVGRFTAISMGIIFVISPLLGAMSDRARKRMPFLVTSTVLCIAFTLLLGRVGFVGTILAFIVANAAYQASLQFYDALLVEVTTESNRGRINGIGVGVGYVGSYIAVGYAQAFHANKPLVFTLVAVSFLAFALPCFMFVTERGNPTPGRVFAWSAVVDSTRRTIDAFRQGERFPGLIRFLIGRMFYTDAINTVIAMMTVYVTNVAVSHHLTGEAGEQMGRFVLLGAITFAIPGGILWGRVVDRIGPKRTLNIVLALWLATFALASATGLFGLPLVCLWVVAAMAGVAIGGTWSSDRPLMLRLTPPDRVGEFYGLYGMVGRFAAVTGPAAWSIIVPYMITHYQFEAARAEGVGVIALLLMVALSYWILRRVDDTPRDWNALAARPGR